MPKVKSVKKDKEIEKKEPKKSKVEVVEDGEKKKSKTNQIAPRTKSVKKEHNKQLDLLAEKRFDEYVAAGRVDGKGAPKRISAKVLPGPERDLFLRWVAPNKDGYDKGNDIGSELKATFDELLKGMKYSTLREQWTAAQERVEKRRTAESLEITQEFIDSIQIRQSYPKSEAEVVFEKLAALEAAYPTLSTSKKLASKTGESTVEQLPKIPTFFGSDDSAKLTFKLTQSKAVKIYSDENPTPSTKKDKKKGGTGKR